MIDAAGNKGVRTILIRDGHIEVRDKAEGAIIESFVHNISSLTITSDSLLRQETQAYAPDYGEKVDITCNVYTGNDLVSYTIELE